MVDGLSQTTVYTVAQDGQGFIWIGTRDGLNRYDGQEFKVYRPEPGRPASISHATVRALLVDSPALWIGTDGGGLNKFDFRTQVFSHFLHDSLRPSSLSNNNVLALCRGSDGQLWIGTRGGGLNLFNERSGTFDRSNESFLGAENKLGRPASSMDSNRGAGTT